MIRLVCTGKLATLEPRDLRRRTRTYEWQASDVASFFPGRQAEILSEDQHVGYFGIIHPDVLKHFDIPTPASVLELDLEPFCYDQDSQALSTHLNMP